MDYPKDKYEYVNCDLCDKDYAEVVLIGKDLYNNILGEFSVVRCKNCGFVYTNPRPYGEELSKYYPDDAGYFIPTFRRNNGEKLNELKKKIWHKLLAAYWGYTHLARTNRLEKALLFPLFLLVKRNIEIQGLPRFRQNGTLLDVGSSYGLYCKWMKELGWKALGVESNKKSAYFGCEEFGLRIINDTFENANINEKFDVVVLRTVLEHLPSPSKALEKVYELLKENGELIIIIPDFMGIEFRLFKEYCYGLHVPNHLNHFSSLTIKEYCEKYGFKVEKIIHHKFDRDFVASAQYMKDGGLNKWLAPVLCNKFFRRTILKTVVILLSYLGMTSRMTIWVKKNGSRNKI